MRPAGRADVVAGCVRLIAGQDVDPGLVLALGGPAPSGLASVVGALGWFPAYVLLHRCVHEAADLPDDRLDEREAALRDRCYLVAYRLIGGTVALSLVLAVADDAADGRIVVSWNGP